MGNLFTTVVYQPFLNILVLFYWLLGFGKNAEPDMGVAVILLTILIRILMLPLSLAGHQSEKERREIATKVRSLEEEFSHDPIAFKKAKEKVIKKSRAVLIGEIFNLFIQVSIALMLYRIFTTGLEGADLHLLYSFMPKVDLPFNLVFWGKYDLAHPNIFLNLIQSLLIFVLETISLLTAPYWVSRKEVVRLQLILPVVSFLVFMGLPAGKKLFVITTLVFSIVLKLFRAIQLWFESFRDKWEEKEKEAEKGVKPEEEKVVVEMG